MTETLTRQEELQSIYWDMYKDAHGFRPRHVDTTDWTEQAFIQEFENLQRIINEHDIKRVAAEEKASHAFEMRVQTMIACGAADRAMAIRWIHEAEGSNGDAEFLSYLMGLPWGYLRKEIV